MVVKKDLVTESMNPYEKPPGQSVGTFIYNRETHAFMGRTAISWAKIGIFYFLFYGVLAALVAICLWGFFQTIDPRRPKWQLDRSLIGTNPGLGFRPTPNKDNVESSLIWFKGHDPDNYMYWVHSLSSFLESYKKVGSELGTGASSKCDYNTLPNPGQVCIVEVRDWTPCTEQNNFGYHKFSPCIFLKLNKIFGWRPEFYNTTEGLPDSMPRSLKTHIANLSAVDKSQLNTIWVSCEGENPADQEHVGPISYFPRQGFPGYYYPFENAERYRSPLVAIHFARPTPGILINIECKAWARNIIHNRHDKLGSVHFELLID